MLASLSLLSSTEQLMDMQRVHFLGKSKFRVCSCEECIVCLVFTLHSLFLFLFFAVYGAEHSRRGRGGQHCMLNAFLLPTLFVFTGNPIDPSRKKASTCTAA